MYPFAASTHDYRCSHTMGVENFGWLHLVIREYSKDTWIGSLLIKGRENDTYRWKRYGIFHPKQTFVYAIYWRWYSIDLLLHNWFSLSLSLSLRGRFHCYHWKHYINYIFSSLYWHLFMWSSVSLQCSLEELG